MCPEISHRRLRELCFCIIQDWDCIIIGCENLIGIDMRECELGFTYVTTNDMNSLDEAINLSIYLDMVYFFSSEAEVAI
jgi:hypothetical protein